jgi:PAS domain S-box-containing protein
MAEQVRYRRTRKGAMKTILLVEDEAIVAYSEKATLEGFGYRVLSARSGKEALEAVHSHGETLDLILMDLDLGEEIDGTETARLILAERNLPIVFLTAHAEREQVEKVKGITRYGYVVKDSGDFVLQSSIEMAFELFEAHEKMRMSEARLSTLLTTIPDLIWLKDNEGRYLSCNAAFERFFGAKECDILGKTDYDFLDEDSADFFRSHDRRVMESGLPNRNEEWITFAEDGHRALLDTLKTPLFGGPGEIIGVLGISRDITEKYKNAEALKESEQSVRRKLDAIIKPEGSISELGLSEIVDIPTLTSLMEDFSALTGMAIAILDIRGKVLIATGWQDICTKFHRANPESGAACTESDLFLSAEVKEGEYTDYRCKNNMWDIVTPLYIDGTHAGNIYSGQFFYDDDEVNESVFAAQAERFGFDKESYLQALRRVPRFSHEEISRLMDYLVNLTDFVSRLSISNLHLSRTLSELQTAKGLLSRSLTEKELLLKELRHRVKNSLSIVSSLLRLNMTSVCDEYSMRVFQETVDRIQSIAMIYDELSDSKNIGRIDLGTYLQNLVAMLKKTYAPGEHAIEVTASMDTVECDLKRAVSVGLILNELFTNALKYASREGGVITVSLTARGERSELTVSDNGPGLAAGFDVKKLGSLGLRISSLLAEEIEGRLSFETDGGTKAVLRF